MSDTFVTDPSWAVQEAVFQALEGHVIVGGATVPVFDGVPQGQAYPYISIDEHDTTDADYLASRKDERRFYLSVWSDKSGKKQVLQIMAAMDALLHRKRLLMETGEMIICMVKRKSTQRDIDRVTYQGLVSLRIVTNH